MFQKTPAKGMRDFLPQEYALRKRLVSTIESVYEKYGFSRIETPCVENLALLCSKQGGDNEKLENADDGQLCDLGLRYDLTVPLARYYSNNVGKLPAVFKAMQIGNVWRADRPQRGRFRQFVQCDIDIIGEPSSLAETELITATCEALDKLRFSDLTVRVNDRRLLTALAKKCGFTQEQQESVFIALDKLDKIGVTGVMAEIDEIQPGKAVPFIDTVNRIMGADDRIAAAAKELSGVLPYEVVENLNEILSVTSRTVKNGSVVFDVTLVRGMGYYTGTIYEISLADLPFSVAGGGRYDKMIGKITGSDVPACGFSIGFERIAMLYAERNPEKIEGVTAVFIDKEVRGKQLADLMERCRFMRNCGKVTVLRKLKNFSYQLKQLSEAGCTIFYEYRNGELTKIRFGND